MSSTTETLDSFFNETKNDLTRFFLRRLNCTYTADDLTQETYLRLYESEQSKQTQNRRALAFHIARNLLVDYIRKERVRLNYAPCQSEEINAIEHIQDSKPNPESRAMIWQDLELVETALQELPKNSRATLYLSVAEGWTYAQIGKHFSVSERMIAKRMAKTMQHCRTRCHELSVA